LKGGINGIEGENVPGMHMMFNFGGNDTNTKGGAMRFHRNAGLLVLFLIFAFFLIACGGGGGSSAPPTPTVTTDNASGITNVAATLDGTVNPNGLATTAWFEWGTSSTLATSDNTATQNFAAGTTVQPVSASISGLTFGSTYYYRLAASNSSGTTRGTIKSFSTAATRPTVTTLAADNLAVTSATLHGTVNPNWLDTSAWFEYGTSSTLASFSTTTGQPIGSGSSDVAVSANLTTLSAGQTIYFRVAASNGAGEQKGEILSFNTDNPPPVANAGADNTVEMGQTVTLNGSASTAGAGTITAYEWLQVNGTAVTLSDNTAVNPTFTAPDVALIGEVLRFQLTVTNSQGLTHSDNVDITVKWVGYSDNFSDNTIGNYTVTTTGGPGITFTWDPVGKRATATVGESNAMEFSDAVTASTSGVFSIDFNPTVGYPSHGGIWIRLYEDATNYYEIANFDAYVAPDLTGVVRKVVNGVAEEQTFTTEYTQTNTYNLTITFSPTQVTLTGFGSTVTLNTTNTDALSVVSFGVESGQQDAYYDNIKLLAHP